MDIKQGIYLGMPDSVYFSTNAISVSGLKDFSIAPAKYKFGDRQTTTAQSLGTLWHTALLEPNELDKRFAPTDVARRGTKDWAAAEMAAGDRELIKRDDWDEMLAMCESVRGQGGPLVDVINYEGMVTEASFFWWDYPSKVFCRGRADIAILEHGFVGDVKSCQDANEDFKFAVKDWLYHWQAAFYKRGMRWLGHPIGDFVFFAIEKKKPYLYKPWVMPESAVDHAEHKIMTLLEQYKVCLEENKWPGYSLEIEALPYPESWLQFE
jgi:hypothetical protein